MIEVLFFFMFSLTSGLQHVEEIAEFRDKCAYHNGVVESTWGKVQGAMFASPGVFNTITYAGPIYLCIKVKTDVKPEKQDRTTPEETGSRFTVSR